jgi:DNA repair exonuclease SbcCD nuclease subunit
LWMIGHIHVHQCHHAGNSATVYYPGSLQGLDAGETGSHGALLIEHDAEAKATVTTVPIGRLAYLKVTLPTDELECSQGALTMAMREAIENSLATDGADVKAVVVDLKIAGNSAHSAAEFRQILNAFNEERIQDLCNRHVTIRKHSYDIRPLPDEIDLGEVADGTDLLGTLAKAIIALENGDLDSPIARDMLDEVTHNVRRTESNAAFGQLSRSPLDREALRQQTITTAYELLRNLHNQRKAQQEVANA